MDFSSIHTMFSTNARRFHDEIILWHRPQTGARYAELTWGQLEEMVVCFASALLDMGFAPGDRLAILACNRLEWLVADLGTLMAGGADVPIDPTNTPSQCEYILNNSQARFIVVEDSDQLTRLTPCLPNIASLEKIILVEGSAPSEEAPVVTWDAVMQTGVDKQSALSEARQQRMQQCDPLNLATIVYTSETSGPPKGCMVSHQNILFLLASIDALHNIASQTNLSLLALPLAHFYPRVFGYYYNLYKNIPLALAESHDTLTKDLRDTAPTFFCCAPAMLEKVYADICEAAEKGSWLKRSLFGWAVGIGRNHAKRVNVQIFEPLLNRLLYRIADRLVFAKIRKRLGGRLAFAFSVGAPLAAGPGEFIRGLGVKVVVFYGRTETLGGTMTTRNATRSGTVGKAMPGFEVALAQNGEILIKGNNFMGYLNNPEQTEAVLREGWCYTGDKGRWQYDNLVLSEYRNDPVVIPGNQKNYRII